MIVALEEAKYKLQNLRPVIDELASALRIDELTINGMAAGGEPVQISMGTITIKWSSVGEVDHYTLSVKNGVRN